MHTISAIAIPPIRIEKLQEYTGSLKITPNLQNAMCSMCHPKCTNKKKYLTCCNCLYTDLNYSSFRRYALAHWSN